MFEHRAKTIASGELVCLLLTASDRLVKGSTAGLEVKIHLRAPWVSACAEAGERLPDRGAGGVKCQYLITPSAPAVTNLASEAVSEKVAGAQISKTAESCETDGSHWTLSEDARLPGVEGCLVRIVV